MRDDGVRYWTLVGFYSDMARLEDEGVLQHEVKTTSLPGGVVKQHWFRLK